MEPDLIDMMREDDLRTSLRKSVSEVLLLRRTFAHTHSSVGNEKNDDSCAECGLDLRDPIHYRIDE